MQGLYAAASSGYVVRVSISNSRVAGNSNAGLLVDGSSGTTILSASNNAISNNVEGIGAFGTGSKMWASGNTVSNNGTGLWNHNTALFESAGDNAVRNNGTDTSGAITTIPKL